MKEITALHHITGIAMSGFGMDCDIAGCKEAGFSEHLTKPIDWQRSMRCYNVSPVRNSGGNREEKGHSLEIAISSTYCGPPHRRTRAKRIHLRGGIRATAPDGFEASV